MADFIPVHRLEFGRVYVAQVSFRPNNPIHRALAYSVRKVGGKRSGVAAVELAAPGYEKVHHVLTDKLAHFAVERELPEFRLNRCSDLGMPNAAPADSRTGDMAICPDCGATECCYGCASKGGPGADLLPTPDEPTDDDLQRAQAPGAA